MLPCRNIKIIREPVEYDHEGVVCVTFTDNCRFDILGSPTLVSGLELFNKSICVMGSNLERLYSFDHGFINYVDADNNEVSENYILNHPCSFHYRDFNKNIKFNEFAGPMLFELNGRFVINRTGPDPDIKFVFSKNNESVNPECLSKIFATNSRQESNLEQGLREFICCLNILERRSSLKFDQIAVKYAFGRRGKAVLIGIVDANISFNGFDISPDFCFQQSLQKGKNLDLFKQYLTNAYLAIANTTTTINGKSFFDAPPCVEAIQSLIDFIQ